jgi:His-Xaa-Ser system protein HxsD
MLKPNSFDENEVIVYLDKNIYSKDSIFKSLYWYGDKFHTNISFADNNTYRVSVKPISTTQLSKIELENLLMKLERDLVDFNLRDIVTKETQNVRDLLVAKAFSNGEFDELPPGEVSDPVGFSPDLSS